jgi:hypothetical protein
MSARSSSSVSNSLASLAHSSEALGEARGEVEDRAGLRTPQLVVELVDDHSGTDAVQEVGGGEALDCFTVDRARNVDGRVRVVDQRELGVGEVGEALAQRVDLFVDVVVGDGHERHFDAQLVVPEQLHLRTDLDNRVELDVAVFLTRGDLDLGRRDDIDVVLVDRFHVVLRQRVLQGLLTRHLAAETRLEQAPGRLAGTKAGDANVPGELAKCIVDRALELGRGDHDVQLDLAGNAGGTVVRCGVFLGATNVTTGVVAGTSNVGFEGFDGALHKEGEVYRGLVRTPAYDRPNGLPRGFCG